MTVKRTKSIAQNDDAEVEEPEEIEIIPIEVEIEHVQMEQNEEAEEEGGEAKNSVTSDDIYKMIKDAERQNRPDSHQMLTEIKTKLAQEVKLKKLDQAFAANAEETKGEGEDETPQFEVIEDKREEFTTFHRMGTNVPIEEM